MAQQIINNGDSGLVARTAINSNFTELYAGAGASVVTTNSLTGAGTGASPLELVNDEASPGNSEYYGTNGVGTKGYYPVPSGTVTLSDLDALPLEAVASSGSSTEVSRYDHIHPYPTPLQIGAAYAATSIAAGTGLTGGGDLSANRSFAVVPNTTNQQVEIQNAGVTIGTRKAINFTAGGGVQIGVSSNPSSDRIDVNVSAPAVPSYLSTVGITFIVDGGVSAITTGVKGDIQIPFQASISRWTLLADQSGSIVWDVWVDSVANYPPTVADTITGSNKPTISNAQVATSITTGWGVSVAAGNTFRFNIDSCTSIQRCTLTLWADKK